MKPTKLIALLLCLVMVVSSFAACGGNGDETSDTQSNAGTLDNDQYIDKDTGEITNIGSDTTLAVTPDEVGTLKNPVVTGLEAYMTDDRKKEHVTWKEEAYGLKYEYDTCEGSQKMAKWISAFVAGDAYDVLWMTSGDFPLVAQNGLLLPIDRIMPVHDEKYFKQPVTDAFTWKDRVYGVNSWQGIDAYGIMYNVSLFENAGEATPRDHYKSGTWTFSQFLSTVKAMHDVSGGASDIYGMAGSDTSFAQAAIVSNGGSVVKYTSEGAELNLKDPKTMKGIEFTNQVREYMLVSGARNSFVAGQSAMYVERQGQINSVRINGTGYEYDWVPFPKGPDGAGEATGLCYAWGIGKGAKNIAGALAWIASDAYRETWFEAHPVEIATETRSKEELEFYATEVEPKSKMDNVGGFDISIWSVLSDAEITGVAAAIEKHAPSYQAKIDDILGQVAQVGAIEFEDQGVFNFESAEDLYPFVNVVGDDKVAYGTADNPSLKIDLSGINEVSALVHTKPELFKLQNGGQYKVTFKLLCNKEPGAESFAVVARTTSALTGDPSFGITWISPKAGVVSEVEAYINVNNAFTGDLAIVLLGSASGENTNVIIDDFRVELVEAE